MKYSDFSRVMSGIDERYRKDMWAISFHGKKAFRCIKRLMKNLKKNVEMFDYESLSMANNEMRVAFNNFRDLFGNIIYRSDSEEAQENFYADLKTISKKLDIAETYQDKPRKKMGLVILIAEMRNTLQYMLNFMKRCRREDMEFEKSVIYNAELMCGRELGRKVIPPEPSTEEMVAGETEEEEGSEESSTEELSKEGLEVFKDIAKSVEE